MSHSLTSAVIVNPPGHVAVLRDWAFCAGFRLCDESKPILLRIAVEAMLAGHALMSWMRRPDPRDGRNRRAARKPSRRRQSRVTIERRTGISAPCAFSSNALPLLQLESNNAPRPAAIGRH